MGVNEMVGIMFGVVAVLLLLREWRNWEADAGADQHDIRDQGVARPHTGR